MALKRKQVERYLAGIAGLSYIEWKALREATERMYDLHKEYTRLPDEADRIDAGVNMVCTQLGVKE